MATPSKRAESGKVIHVLMWADRHHRATLHAFFATLESRGGLVQGYELREVALSRFIQARSNQQPIVLALGPVRDDFEPSESREGVLQAIWELVGQTPSSVFVVSWNNGETRVPATFRSHVFHLDRDEEVEHLLHVLQLPTLSEPEREPTGIQYASTADRPSSEDTIGFKPYVDAMTTFLVNEHTRPPLTLSIEGEWGSGKSSFMLQLENALRGKLAGAARFVRFNAWRHEKGEALWAAFALEFSRQVAPSSVWRRGLARLRLGAARLKNGQGWLGVMKLVTPLLLLAVASVFTLETLKQHVEKVLAVIALISAPLSVPFIKKAWEFFGNPFSVDLRKLEAAPDYESRTPFLEQFHEDFRLILQHYAEGAQKVFVFVDDLDRCEVPRAADLLQAINLMIPEDSKVIFILGIDREKVAAGIAMRHEKLLPLVAPPARDGSGKLAFDPLLAADFGRDFLERFIQLPFRLPQPTDEQLEGLLGKLLAPPSGASTSQSAMSAPSPAASPSMQSPGGTASLPAPTAPPEATRTRRATLIRQAESDSAEVRAVLRMVAPSLDFNPRRLKQFLNLFRLSAYIANNTGLFDEASEGRRPLTLPQLGKFVAIGLRWPRLQRDLVEVPDLISQLENPKTPANSAAATRWRAEPAVLRLLEESYKGLDPYADAHFPWLEGVDFQRLRTISATVTREEPSPASGPQASAHSLTQGSAALPDTMLGTPQPWKLP